MAASFFLEETWTLIENGDRDREMQGAGNGDRAGKQINYLSPGSAETVISATRAFVVIGDERRG